MAQFEYVLWLVEFLRNTYFEFEWDNGNLTKSEIKHGTYAYEAEEVFYDRDILPLENRKFA